MTPARLIRMNMRGRRGLACKALEEVASSASLTFGLLAMTAKLRQGFVPPTVGAGAEPQAPRIDIAMDLGQQFLDTGEFLLGAQTGDEIQAQDFAVKLAPVVIQEVRLHHRSGRLVLKGRAHANVGDGTPAPVTQGCPGEVDPPGGPRP